MMLTENGAVLCHVDDLKEGGTKGFFRKRGRAGFAIRGEI